MAEYAERYRRQLGIAVFGVSFTFVAALVVSLVGYGEDGGKLATNVLLEFFVSLLAVGFGLIVIDPPLSRMFRNAEEQDRKKRRETEEQIQEDRYVAELREQLHSRVPGVAARASEELHRRNWFQKNSLNDIHLSGANLSGAILIGAKMRECMAIGTDFSNADLRYVDFTEADLRNATFANSDLSGAMFKDADLRGVNFDSAFLDSADLSQAVMLDANLKNAHIDGANVGWDGTEEGFEMEGGTILTPAKFDQHTVLPDGQLWTPDTDMTRYTSAPISAD